MLFQNWTQFQEWMEKTKTRYTKREVVHELDSPNPCFINFVSRSKIAKSARAGEDQRAKATKQASWRQFLYLTAQEEAIPEFQPQNY